jgi:hypothetical protein
MKNEAEGKWRWILVAARRREKASDVTGLGRNLLHVQAGIARLPSTRCGEESGALWGRFGSLVGGGLTSLLAWKDSRPSRDPRPSG